jgi:hypothetical protein
MPGQSATIMGHMHASGNGLSQLVQPYPHLAEADF